MYFARDVFVPIALSLLLSIVLSPITHLLQRIGLQRVPAVLITFVCSLVIIVAVVATIGREMTGLVQDVPRYKAELTAKVKSLGTVGTRFEKLLGSMQNEVASLFANKKTAVTDGSNDVPDASTTPGIDKVAFGTSATNPIFVQETRRSNWFIAEWADSLRVVAGPVGTLGLVLVMTLFMMVYQDDLRDRMVRGVSGVHYVTSLRALNEASERIARYLVAQAIVNSAYGLIVAAGLWLIGMIFGGGNVFPQFLLWGFLCTLLRFVPYLGPVVAGFFPIAVSVLVYPGFTVFLAVVVLITLVELLSNNILEPWLYGSSTGITATAVIFAAVFWGWLWGPVGLLLATPLTVSLVVLGKYFDAFFIFKTLFGERDGAPTTVQLYQRLLASDVMQTERLLRSEVQNNSIPHVLDSLLIPVLRQVQRDRKGKRLAFDDCTKLETTLKTAFTDLVVDEAKKAAAISEKAKSDSTVEIVSLEAGDEASSSNIATPVNLSRLLIVAPHNPLEDIIAEAGFSRTILSDFDVSILLYQNATSDFDRRLAQFKPDYIVILHLPPASVNQTQFLLKRTRRQSPKARCIVLGLNRIKRSDQSVFELRRSGASYVTTTVVETHRRLRNYRELDLANAETVSQQNLGKPASVTETPQTVG